MKDKLWSSYEIHPINSRGEIEDSYIAPRFQPKNYDYDYSLEYAKEQKAELEETGNFPYGLVIVEHIQSHEYKIIEDLKTRF